MTVIRRIKKIGYPDAQSFLDQAETQLEHARIAAVANDYGRALVFSYRAALRAAGALISMERKGRKRLPAGSAWVRLRKLNPGLKSWVLLFEHHARLAGRVDMGLARNLTDVEFADVYADACDFVDFAQERLDEGQQAA